MNSLDDKSQIIRHQLYFIFKFSNSFVLRVVMTAIFNGLVFFAMQHFCRHGFKFIQQMLFIGEDRSTRALQLYLRHHILEPQRAKLSHHQLRDPLLE